MRYFSELKRSMEFIAKNKKTFFIGQAVEEQGSGMRNTLKGEIKKKLLELPVAEEMQMGITIGMLMNNYIPVSIFPRWNFLLLALNQLVNHLDKLPEMTNNYYSSKAIIRTSIGAQRPLHPQSQHISDFTRSVKMMTKTITVVKLNEPKQIFNEYKKALNRKNSTILVEYGDYYNEK